MFYYNFSFKVISDTNISAYIRQDQSFFWYQTMMFCRSVLRVVTLNLLIAHIDLVNKKSLIQPFVSCLRVIIFVWYQLLGTTMLLFVLVFRKTDVQRCHYPVVDTPRLEILSTRDIIWCWTGGRTDDPDLKPERTCFQVQLSSCLSIRYIRGPVISYNYENKIIIKVQTHNLWSY